MAALVLVECVVFAVAGRNFLTVGNAFEITRLAVEVGLLALVLTPVIVTGGIDLSVGSMMGLCAVALGALWRDAGLALPVAVAATLGLGVLGGLLNATLITKLRVPPLIVTLGTFSLYRGLAEGITGGVISYSGFPAGFLSLGQGYLGGAVPTQLVLFVPAAVACWWWLQRTVQGRALVAIGFAGDGARYAGIPVERRVASVYLVSGGAAALAAVIYVAHLGQAKSDAGTGYELMAITAVVLGGASIFGGRGTIPGTLLGLFAIVILQNGLRLSGQPAELAGILTGVLLVGTLLLDTRVRTRMLAARATIPTIPDAEPDVRNSQVAVLSGVILAAALIVAGSNWYLVRTLRQQVPPAAAMVASAAPTTVAVMPKAKGDPYFISARLGAEAEAKRLGVELLWDGPTDLDPAKQNEVVEAWITRGVSAIAVSVENRAAISTVLRKARQRGVKVVTWDADAEPDARDFFVNQATPEGIGTTLADEAARIMGGSGDFVVITASLSAANQNEWLRYIRQRIAEKYPAMHLVAVQPSDGDRDRAFAETQTALKVHPSIKLVMAIAAPAVPGAAEAVKQSGRKDVKVTGLSLPNMCRSYIKDGIVDSIVLWKTVDLGALAVAAAHALSAGTLRAGATTLDAGALGQFTVSGDQILLGKPFVFTRANIDQFNF